MPRTATITAPDGRTATLTIPDRATEEQIQAAVMRAKDALRRSGPTPTRAGGEGGAPEGAGAFSLADFAGPQGEHSPTARQFFEEASRGGGERSRWLRTAGQVVGGMIGGTLASPAAVPFLGPLAPVVGAGLGTAAGGSAVDALEALMGRQVDTSVPAMLTRGLEDFNIGGQGEISGQIIGRGLGAAARAIGLSRVPTGREQRILRTAEQHDIPLMAGDVTHSGLVTKIEKAPTYFVFGSQPIQRFRERQLERAGAAIGRYIDDATRVRANRQTAGIVAQRGLKGAYQQFRREAEALFQRVDDLAGPDPVVPTDNLRSMARSILREAATEPYSAPRGTEKILRAGEDIFDASRSTPSMGRVPGPERAFEAEIVDELARVPRSRRVPDPKLRALETRAVGMPETGVSPYTGRAFEAEIVDDIGVGDLEAEIFDAIKRPYITFDKARRIEAQLGEMAFRRAQPIGNIREGQAKALYKAIRDDMDEFLLETERGQRVLPALEEAKQHYRVGRALYNDSINATVMGRMARGQPERLVPMVFKPGPGGVSNVLDFKMAVDPDTYEAAVSAWLRSLHHASLAQDAGQVVFKPATFARLVRRYDVADDGVNHLDVILGPERADQLRDLLDVFDSLGTAEKLAGNPSGTGQALAGAAQLAAIANALTRATLSGAGAAGLSALGGVPMAAAAAGLPPALSRVVTSPQGIRFLREGVTGGRWAQPTASLIGQTGSATGANEAVFNAIMQLMSGGALVPARKGAER